MSTKRWLKKFDDTAAHEGWNVFVISGNLPPRFEQGDIVIQRVDDPTVYDWFDPKTMGDNPHFESDEAAEKFVRAQAKKGSPHAIRALELITNTQISKVPLKRRAKVPAK